MAHPYDRRASVAVVAAIGGRRGRLSRTGRPGRIVRIAGHAHPLAIEFFVDPEALRGAGADLHIGVVFAAHALGGRARTVEHGDRGQPGVRVYESVDAGPCAEFSPIFPHVAAATARLEFVPRARCDALRFVCASCRHISVLPVLGDGCPYPGGHVRVVFSLVDKLDGRPVEPGHPQRSLLNPTDSPDVFVLPGAPGDRAPEPYQIGPIVGDVRGRAVVVLLGAAHEAARRAERVHVVVLACQRQVRRARHRGRGRPAGENVFDAAPVDAVGAVDALDGGGGGGRDAIGPCAGVAGVVDGAHPQVVRGFVRQAARGGAVAPVFPRYRLLNVAVAVEAPQFPLDMRKSGVRRIGPGRREHAEPAGQRQIGDRGRRRHVLVDELLDDAGPWAQRAKTVHEAGLDLVRLSEAQGQQIGVVGIDALGLPARVSGLYPPGDFRARDARVRRGIPGGLEAHQDLRRRRALVRVGGADGLDAIEHHLERQPGQRRHGERVGVPGVVVDAVQRQRLVVEDGRVVLHPIDQDVAGVIERDGRHHHELARPAQRVVGDRDDASGRGLQAGRHRPEAHAQGVARLVEHDPREVRGLVLVRDRRHGHLVMQRFAVQREQGRLDGAARRRPDRQILLPRPVRVREFHGHAIIGSGLVRAGDAHAPDDVVRAEIHHRRAVAIDEQAVLAGAVGQHAAAAAQKPLDVVHHRLSGVQDDVAVVSTAKPKIQRVAAFEGALFGGIRDLGAPVLARQPAPTPPVGELARALAEIVDLFEDLGDVEDGADGCRAGDGGGVVNPGSRRVEQVRGPGAVEADHAPAGGGRHGVGGSDHLVAGQIFIGVAGGGRELERGRIEVGRRQALAESAVGEVVVQDQGGVLAVAGRRGRVAHVAHLAAADRGLDLRQAAENLGAVAESAGEVRDAAQPVRRGPARRRRQQRRGGLAVRAAIPMHDGQAVVAGRGRAVAGGEHVIEGGYRLVVDQDLRHAVDLSLAQRDRHVQIFVFRSAGRHEDPGAGHLPGAVHDRDRRDVRRLVDGRAGGLVRLLGQIHEPRNDFLENVADEAEKSHQALPHLMSRTAAAEKSKPRSPGKCNPWLSGLVWRPLFCRQLAQWLAIDSVIEGVLPAPSSL